MAATTVTLPQSEMPLAHELRGRVGMWCLIAAESAIFSIFVVAYLYYAGKSLNGPTPREVLHVPIFNSICLFASSFTIVMAERAIARGKGRLFGIWWLLTIVLGAIFILGTAREWYHLIYVEGLTISSSLFGTTFYSLVGLHGFHVIVGLIGLSIIMIFAALGHVKQEHAARIEVFAMYWHFVDAIWVVVLTVVYFVAI
ncbi:MAG TPA: heme-copper oxidase subunit III [Candidatus Limnocylindrales bacterium]|jgi:cytochrome c oxidase subunit 3|nr:heme-copper oxidase subunit III [Candidatus Limnocylindrales bacterium]